MLDTHGLDGQAPTLTNTGQTTLGQDGVMLEPIITSISGTTLLPTLTLGRAHRLIFDFEVTKFTSRTHC